MKEIITFKYKTLFPKHQISPASKEKQTEGSDVALALQLLHVNRLQHFLAALHRRLGKLLTAAQLTHDASLLKFTLQLFQRALNVLAFFYGYNDHSR